MNQQEQIKALNSRIEMLEKELSIIKNFTTNLGGSLEFRKLVETYAGGSSATQTIGNLSVSTTFGLFGATPVGQQSNIAAPTGGITIDTEARATINSIRTVLDNFGFTA